LRKNATIKFDFPGDWMLGFYRGLVYVLTPTRLRIKLNGTCMEVLASIKTDICEIFIRK
jgi:hypothetical protein